MVTSLILLPCEQCQIRIYQFLSCSVPPITINLRSEARQPAAPLSASLPQLLEWEGHGLTFASKDRLRPQESLSASLSFAAFDLCR